jgi:hypothetical protein
MDEGHRVMMDSLVQGQCMKDVRVKKNIPLSMRRRVLFGK